MGKSTEIGWTDHTFNPWWGCSRVSPGCQHCYAEALAKRTGHDVWGISGDRRHFAAQHWAEPEVWNRRAEAKGRPALVFCASMADVFEDRRDLDDDRALLWDLIERTPWLRWQLLTKRPEHVRDLVPAHWLDRWPSTAWIGTTIEDDDRARARIPVLLDVPAPVRFLSCEPLLEPLHLSRWLATGGIGWVIVGGESGPAHRTLTMATAEYVCAQVLAARVPLFFKQWGGRTPSAGGNMIDPYRTGELRQYLQFPPEAGR